MKMRMDGEIKVQGKLYISARDFLTSPLIICPLQNTESIGVSGHCIETGLNKPLRMFIVTPGLVQSFSLSQMERRIIKWVT